MTSTASSVIYFGGSNVDERLHMEEDYVFEVTNRVVEYSNLKWSPLGYLASSRSGHRSIQIENKIYLFGGSFHHGSDKT